MNETTKEQRQRLLDLAHNGGRIYGLEAEALNAIVAEVERLEAALANEERALDRASERANLWSSIALTAQAERDEAQVENARLREALEGYRLPLTGNDRADRAEYGDFAVDREHRRRAATGEVSDE
jgi:hypothetical protein